MWIRRVEHDIDDTAETVKAIGDGIVVVGTAEGEYLGCIVDNLILGPVSLLLFRLTQVQLIVLPYDYE